jgi:hypothetical protein
MSVGETMAQRRARLSAEIARQRGDLAHAYLSLHKPIEMGETGLQAFGFVRKNAWIFPAVTTTVTVGSTLLSLLGITKGKESKVIAAQRKRLAELEREKAPKGIAGHAVKWGGRGLKLFNLYRRVKKFIP